MIVAIGSIHIHYGFSSVNTIGLTSTGPVFGPPGYEINLLYIVALVALSLAGPSALSVDAWLRSHRSRRHIAAN
jgi:putative oxidoreductase